MFILPYRENPSIILFPNSQKGSRLHICLEKICDSASSIQVMIVARKYFDETEGQHLLTELMSEGHGLNLEKDMEKKYLALAASCCVYKYLECNQSTLLHPHTVCIEWREVTEIMHLSYTALTHLELLFDNRNLSTKPSLFHVINHTHTIVGKRLLRSFLLTPSADATTLNGRLDLIDAFLNHRDILADVGSHLALYGDIDEVLFTLAVKSKETSVRSAVQTVKNLLRLRRDLDLLEALASCLQPLQTSIAQVLITIFRNAEWKELSCRMDQFFDATRDISSLGGTQKHQLCLCIRSGLSPALDVNRSVYLQAMEDTQALAEQYVHEAPCEIRVTSSISRGFYLLVSAKNRSYLSG